MRLNIYRISSLPDLSLVKYAQLSSNNVDDVVALHGTFLRQLSRLLQMHKIGMHLLYLYDPNEKMHMRLQAYLMWTCEELEGLHLIRDILPHTPLSDYFLFEKVEGFGNLDQSSFTHGATMIKRERQVTVIKSDTRMGVDFYCVPEWKPNQNCRLIDTLHMMEALGEASGKSCALRIDIFAADESDRMRTAFQPYLTKLNEMTDHMSSNLLHGVHMVTVRDNNATTTIREYEEWQRKLETDRHFGMNIYAFSSHPAHASILLSTLHAEAMLEGDCDILPLRINDTASVMERMSPTNTVERYSRRINNAAMSPNELNSWSTTYTWQECAAMFKFPVLFEGEELNMLRESDPIKEQDGMELAITPNKRSIYFPLNHLSKHALICGAPGSGKTNSMLHITTQLWKKYKIPFLVFEPAKKEYRAMFNDPDLNGVYLFSPCVGTDFPLMINPFEFPHGMILSEHLSMLMNVFRGTFEMPGPTEYFLDESIQKAYLQKGWKIDSVNDGSLAYPSLSSVYSLLEEEIDKKSYSDEYKGDVRAFIEVRIGSLMKRDSGVLFNVNTSTFTPDQWLKIPAIIELESLGESAKNFLILLLCTQIYESLRLSPNGDQDTLPYTRHVIFIEEAHNLIAQQTNQESSESVNPKISATAFLVKMLAEVRALRESIVIADQLPSVLAPEVVKNTGLKIIHRMTSQDDRSHVGSTMNASESQLMEVATYSTGEALLYFEGLIKAFNARICQWDFEKAPPGNSRYLPLQNEKLKHIVHSLPGYEETVLQPYILSCEYRRFDEISEPLNDMLSFYNQYKKILLEINPEEPISEEIHAAIVKNAKEFRIKKTSWNTSLGSLESMVSQSTYLKLDSEIERKVKIYRQRLDELTNLHKSSVEQGNSNEN